MVGLAQTALQARTSRSTDVGRTAPGSRLASAFVGLLTASLGACEAGTSTDGSTGGVPSTGSFVVASTGTGGDGPNCAKYEHTEVHKPVNLYVIFDKSSSMAGSKWEDAKTGLSAYVDAPGADSIRAALRFFPRVADATPACDQNAYKEPTVPFAELPGNAAAIKAAIDAEAPNGFNTPMYPALGGALLKGIELAMNNSGEVSAVLLITDGAPQGPGPTCSGVNPEDPTVIADLAATGLAKGVATYVVGLPGVNQSVANQIAAAGGTDSAILVASTNVAVEFQKALQKVSGSAIPCDYAIPAEVISGEVGLNKVNIEVTPPGGMPMTVPYDEACSNGGWKYDDAAMPTAIVLCPATCDAVKTTNGAKLKVLLGCGTIVK